MSYAIGIDLGGTKIHGILLKDGRHIVERIHLEHEKRTREAVCEVLYRVAQTLRAKAGARALPIGLGVPSTLDLKKEVILNPLNFPALKGLRLAAWMRKQLRAPVKMENDARCFALGAVLGSKLPKNRSVVVGITIGTGLGGGVVVNGRFWNGAHGIAGAVGHTVLFPDGELCACGRRGCLEMYASAKLLALIGGGRTPKELEKLALGGNEKAREAYQQLGRHLGIGISNVVRTVDPDVVVLGGGITRAWKLFVPAAREVVRATVPSPARSIPIVPAKNPDDAGALGAASLFDRV